VWDVDSGDLRDVIRVPYAPVQFAAAAISPDGRSAVVGWGREARLRRLP
jgi:hypothetical protein